MAQNFLTGSIPTTFGNLTSLSMLNLSHNNLSGSIPQSLSVLKSLIKLDLLYNHLHGEVPMFGNATAVSLEGNGWFCGGATYLHMQSCTADSKKTQIGYYLIRVLDPSMWLHVTRIAGLLYTSCDKDAKNIFIIDFLRGEFSQGFVQ